MPVNCNALIRYITIDKRLRTRTKPSPTLRELLQLCKEKTDVKSLSVRTVQQDLFDMRYNTGLGFHAPIEVRQEFRQVTYRYSEPDYSIAKTIEKL